MKGKGKKKSRCLGIERTQTENQKPLRIWRNGAGCRAKNEAVTLVRGRGPNAQGGAMGQIQKKQTLAKAPKAWQDKASSASSKKHMTYKL